MARGDKWVNAASTQPQMAEFYVNRALQENPANVRALGMLVKIRRDQGRLAEATALAERVVELQPNDWWRRVSLAEDYVNQRRPNECLNHIFAIWNVRPPVKDGDYLLRGLMCRAYVSTGHAQSAVDQMASVNFSNLRSQWVAYCAKQYAYAIWEIGQRDTAIAWLDSVFKFHPTDSQAAGSLFAMRSGAFRAPDAPGPDPAAVGATATQLASTCASCGASRDGSSSQCGYCGTPFASVAGA